MHSRAYVLLEREHQEWKEANVFGIFAAPINDNLLEWLAEVQGLKDSLWEGAVLQLTLKYSESYNSVPPSVSFNTIPFHPNGKGHRRCCLMDQHSGKPCIDFLDDPNKWNRKLTMCDILLTIQVMLSNPVLENAVNMEAAEMLKNNLALYRQMVIQCVRTSQRLEELLRAKDDSISSLQFYPSSEASSLGCISYRRITSISFEDYHRTWSGIATSKAKEYFKAPLFEDPVFMGNYYSWKERNLIEAGGWDENIYKTIMSQLIRRQRKQKNERLLKMSNEKQDNYQLWQTTDVLDPIPKSQATGRERPIAQEKEPWEEEVDNLVAWTNTLSTKGLED
ncbi:PREDICTED: ubiquitin-conjugating enzyme E2 U isoform X1 [Gavialis gangeticus]|uniref:ubiquitin-conjugating enzyme E2 U isoform X1 n=1 Tax=Gavialis gangeticus TaxID=94835 RepID=UPI00092EE988|nr:PREDICTED: ubiquitin-conjugating enzyme E2 U isoform X1 [Gavialis gangeticus]